MNLSGQLGAGVEGDHPEAVVAVEVHLRDHDAAVRIDDSTYATCPRANQATSPGRGFSSGLILRPFATAAHWSASPQCRPRYQLVKLMPFELAQPVGHPGRALALEEATAVVHAAAVGGRRLVTVRGRAARRSRSSRSPRWSPASRTAPRAPRPRPRARPARPRRRAWRPAARSGSSWLALAVAGHRISGGQTQCQGHDKGQDEHDAASRGARPRRRPVLAVLHPYLPRTKLARSARAEMSFHGSQGGSLGNKENGAGGLSRIGRST